MEKTRHSEKEVVNYTATLNFIINQLFKTLDKIHKKNEQYFGECSILGVDRTQLLKDIRKLLEDYQKDTLKKVLDDGNGK